MTYSYERELLGTAGGVKNNSWFLDETFCIVSGDALTNIDLTEMYKFHKEKCLGYVGFKTGGGCNSVWSSGY